MVVRHPCLFYGFSWPEHTSRLIDEGDNRCALIFEGSSACAMERENRPISHRACRIYRKCEAAIDVGRPYIVIYANEFPAGISLEAWETYLIGRTSAT